MAPNCKGTCGKASVFLRAAHREVYFPGLQESAWMFLHAVLLLASFFFNCLNIQQWHKANAGNSYRFFEHNRCLFL